MKAITISIIISFFIGCFSVKSQDVKVSGRFEGSNVVDVSQVSANNFTCKLKTPPMAAPESNRYTTSGDHYHNWFMLKIENAAGQTVNISITNADWGAGGFWDREDGKAVYTEATDPNALSSDTTWKKITNATYTSPNFTFTLTPDSNLVWVALCYPALPTHTFNWISALSDNPYVDAEVVTNTSQGLPLHMLFVTDTTYPDSMKKSMLIYGQEHSNEQTGGIACQGLVDFLVSGDTIAQKLLQNMIFIVIPDVFPDATYAGITNDPDNGLSMEWRVNPAAMERMMPGMSGQMTLESKAIWNRIDQFVNSGNHIDFAFNLHQGGMDNWFGVYELGDIVADNFDGFLRDNMPGSGASWVPNNLQGYSRGGWQDVVPYSWPSLRILGRCWEEWRTTAMGYEISVGARANNYLNNMSGIKYFGEAIALALYDYYGSFNKTLTILTPNGGEMLTSGGTTSVSWTSAGSPGNVNIDCSTDGGATWQNLISSTVDDGSETVTLPGDNSDNCLFRISSTNNMGVVDESDSICTIGTPPVSTINLTYPNGGETLEANYWDTITWTSTGTVSIVNIEISLDGGIKWKRMAYAIPNNNSYVLNIPGSTSAQCLVKVTNAENLSISDVSDTFNSIQSQTLPGIELVSPNGGENMLPGSTDTILWNSVGFSSNVGIRISTDEGANWTTLISSTANDGNEIVTMPVVYSSRCLIWIYEATQNAYISQPNAIPLDVSDNLFTIDTVPFITSTTDSSRCGPGTVTLGATASAGIVNWYASQTGGSSLGSGTIFNTPALTSTTSYYVDATNNGSTTATRKAVTATINSVPTITGTTDGTRCGTGTVDLGAIANTGVISWYSASTGGSSLGSGTSFTTPSLTTNAIYYVDATNNGCSTATRTAVTATINPVPTITGTTNGTRCGTGTVDLEATASAGIINWYSASTGGSSLDTGTNFTTPSITSTTTYYVDATNNGCTTATRTEVTADVSCTQTGNKISPDLIKVFPNPTSGEIIVKAAGIEKVEIINTNGQTVFISEDNSPEIAIDLSNNPKGIYIIKVTTDKIIMTRKLIKLAKK